MPVTQEPTLQPVDTEHNQFQVQFGLQMSPGENPLDVSVPNLGGLTLADVYTIDFQKVNTPARGNFPAFRCFQVVLETVQQGTGATSAGAIYLVNPRTSQLLVLMAPNPTLNSPSLILASVPFFVKSNQSILVYRAKSSLSVASLSVTALTFDCPAFFSVMSPTS
jgi:hypothetical protein